TDSTVQSGTYYYVVKAVNILGQESTPSNQVQANITNTTAPGTTAPGTTAPGTTAPGTTPPGTTSSDTITPSVFSTSPPGGTTIATGACLTVSAAASDYVGVVGVQFKLENANLGGETSTPPYTISWNPKRAGVYRIYAVARDAAGNQMASAPVSVT